MTMSNNRKHICFTDGCGTEAGNRHKSTILNAILSPPIDITSDYSISHDSENMCADKHAIVLQAR